MIPFIIDSGFENFKHRTCRKICNLKQNNIAQITCFLCGIYRQICYARDNSGGFAVNAFFEPYSINAFMQLTI